MCGICGELSLDGHPAASADVHHMMAALTHRGPDESALFVDQDSRIGLGHTRLKIIDLSPAAGQPMTNEDGTLRIVFNGEIYNYRELTQRLRSSGHVFRSHSDTETILHLYEEKGECCVEELDGMFAFAIWNSRRRSLFLARDPVGKKPLYYYRDATRFAFASEIKALFRHPSIRADIDDQQITNYFLYGYVPTPSTLYRRVWSLPPGHSLTVSASGDLEQRQYWDLRFPENGDTGGEPSGDRDVASHVRALVTAAVRKRLVSDVPLGAFLSGGIDSTIVVGVMSQLRPGRVKTFSIGYRDNPSFDERRFARIAAARFKTAHTEFVVEPDAIDIIEKLVWHHDGPFGDPSGIPTYILSRLAREHVTVALNGDGGDEVFAGYQRFQGSMVAEWIPRPLLRAGSVVLSRFSDARSYYGAVRKTQRFFRSAALPLYERYAKWISFFYDDLEMLVHRDILAGQGPVDRISYFRSYLPTVARYRPLARLLYLNVKTYLVDDLLVKMDRATMANGLEARSPFLDRDLMRYIALLPDRMKLRWGTSKYILRKAFADLVPKEICQRSKMGFGVPLDAWFRGDLREFVHDLLLSSESRSRIYLNQEYVGRLIRDHLTGRQDNAYRLWAVLTFEVWLRALPGWAARASADDWSGAFSRPDVAVSAARTFGAC